MEKKVVLFTSGSCTPCREIEERVAGHEQDVEVVDIDTDEGFKRFSEQVLQRGEGAVPSAYLNGQKCQILLMDDDGVEFNCPDAPPEGPPN